MRIIFVHGTGVRETWFNVSFAAIQKAVEARGLGEAVPCYWGEAAGVPDVRDFKSIPRFAERGGDGHVSDAAAETAIWEMLARDPEAELRIFVILSGGDDQFGSSEVSRAMDHNLRRLANEGEFGQCLAGAGIAEQLLLARDQLLRSKTYPQALEKADEHPNTARLILARHLVALAVFYASQDGRLPPVVGNVSLRTELVNKLSDQIHPAAMGVGQFISDHLTYLGLRAATYHVNDRFGDLVDQQYRFIADILRYQSRGEHIRQVISRAVSDANTPCILLGHSLGGIAVVDYVNTCCREGNDELKLLQGVITVGSQSPFFYEVDALASLENGQPLPGEFPPWLNILDRSDFLSFLARPVFGNRAVDFEADCRQPFPRSHGAYWVNPEVWERIADFVREMSEA